MDDANHILWEEFLQSRTPDLKRKLVVQYLDLVRYVVSKFGLHQQAKSHGLEFDDCVHFGVLGLLAAVERFTPARGVKFETYAVPRIRGAVLDEMRKLDWVPRSVREASRKAGKAAHQIMQEEGREPVAAEVAGKLGLSIHEYQTLLAGGAVTVRRDVERAEGHESAEALDAAPSDEPTPFDQVRDQEVRRILRDAIDRLPERDRLVIALYYYEGLKFTEIARVLDLSEGRISQIHADVLRQLRTTLVMMEA